MSFVSTLLKKFKISKKVQNKSVLATSRTTSSIWTHSVHCSSSEDVKFDEKIQTHKCLQKKIQAAQKAKKTLRRQPRFIGSQMLMSKQVKKNQRLRKQKSINSSFLRKLVSVRQMEKAQKIQI